MIAIRLLLSGAAGCQATAAAEEKLVAQTGSPAPYRPDGRKGEAAAQRCKNTHLNSAGHLNCIHSPPQRAADVS